MKQRSALLANGLKGVGVSILTVALLGGCAETKLVANTAKMATQQDAPSTQPYKIGKPYQVDGAWYYPKADYDYDETGIASWYGPGFHGGNTANGEVYDQSALTAAHKTLPMPSLVRVTNLENGRSIVVRINDRGPFVNNRIIDMTQRGAQLLGFDMNGTAKVRVQVLKEESMILAAQASQQGGDDVPPPPKASPAGTVAATALPPTGQTSASAAAPSSAAPSAIQSKAGPGTPAATAGQTVTGQTPAAAPSPSVSSTALPKPQTAPATAPAATQTAALPPATAPTTTVKPAVTATPAPSAATTAAKPTAAPAKTTAMGPVADLPKPDGKVTVEPVKGNSSIYIQAGAFLRQNNAQQLSTKLAALGTSRVTQVKLGQQTFFRVRLGPIASVEKADELLQQVISDGNPEARIIIE